MRTTKSISEMMEDLVILETPPIDPTDLVEISRMLREALVFLPAFSIVEDALYDVYSFISEQGRFGSNVVLIADRNLFTRWIGLVNLKKVTAQHRLAAAALAFAQCADIGIEPNMALYEIAAQETGQAAQMELALFRRIDNTHPAIWADIALGRRDGVEEGVLAEPPSKDQHIDFNMPLRNWRRHYAVLLKVAELELFLKGKPIDRALALLQWLHQDFMFKAPALSLALHYFLPISGRGKLLKNLRAEDRNRALDGVRNAVWDLAITSEWIERQQTANTAVLLGTFDRWLRKIVKATTSTDYVSAPEDRFSSIIAALWGRCASIPLINRYNELMARSESLERAYNRGPLEIDRLIREGEARLTAWTPHLR